MRLHDDVNAPFSLLLDEEKRVSELPQGGSPRPRIGIFGGSFNPIHKGHIALARQILRKAQLEEVWFLVTPLNPFKKAAADLLDDRLRLEMTREALLGEEGLLASDYEFHLPKPSYTWDTLQHLSKDYPEKQFVLIIGADNWQEWNKWYHAEDILRCHEVVVYPREGFPVDESKPAQRSSIRKYRTLQDEFHRHPKARAGGTGNRPIGTGRYLGFSQKILSLITESL